MARPKESGEEQGVVIDKLRFCEPGKRHPEKRSRNRGEASDWAGLLPACGAFRLRVSVLLDGTGDRGAADESGDSIFLLPRCGRVLALALPKFCRTVVRSMSRLAGLIRGRM